MEYSELELKQIKEKYKLTDEEYIQMYEKCKYVTFYNCIPNQNPTAIFVGGQTGSGKGGIDIYSQREFIKNDVAAAVIDIDVYRALYPKVNEILKEYPTIYTNITAEVTGRIVKQMLEYAIENKYSFIFEGTMKNTEAFETMKRMPKYFNKIIRIMAVPKYESLLTAFERNNEQVNITGYGRFTNVKTHNITYKGLVDTIKIIEEEDKEIIIEVFARGKDMTSPKKIFNSGENKEKPSNILVRERNKAENSISIEKTKERLNKLLFTLRPKDKYEEEQLKKLIDEIEKMTTKMED